MNSYEYPTDEQLKTISEWDVLVGTVRDLVDYVESLWWAPDWGFVLKGKRVLHLELHTGGWSGNEAIIEALAANFMFWSLYWRKATAGGHYWFKIDLRASS